MATSLLYPNVIDGSTLGPLFTSNVNLPISIEGQAAATGGTAEADIEYTIQRPSDASTLFGETSSLTQLIQFVLARGVAPVFGIASVLSATAPTLTQREAAWSVQEQNPNTRIRLTDASDQTTFEGLANSCNNADLIYNKQIAFGGLPAGNSKATVILCAENINSQRFVLVAPGVIDASGNLWSGNYGAALAASAVAINPNIADDLNLDLIPNFNSIELNSVSQPLFLLRVVSGEVVNDFEDCLQGGVSPLMTNQQGLGLQITHLRMTYTGQPLAEPPVLDYTYDALMTRLIVDQLFINVRQYCLNNNFLQQGNTPTNLAALTAGVQALLASYTSWIQPVTQPDGTSGFGVACTPSADMRTVYITYQGIVVRGISQISVNAELTIPV